MAQRFVVEADGGSRGNPGPAAFGTVVRTATGEVLMEIAETLGRTTNNVAEYRGLIAGLEAVHQLDAAAQIEARLDSKLVVEQMSGRWKIKHPEMRELAIRARGAHPPELVTYTWVPREKNRAADRLVNAALDGTWDPGAALTEDLSEDAAASTDVPSGPLPGTLPGWSPQVGVTTTTLLLRHGHTRHSAAKRFSGSGGDDPELNELGVAEAQSVAEALAARGGIDVIVSSPMRRTRQTADAVASALECAVVEEPDFRECDFGEWEGCTFSEVQERWPDELAAWLRSTAVATRGGESFDAVLARVDEALARLCRDHAGQAVLVVSHVTPIKALVRAALGVGPAALFRMELLPASISTVRWYEDGTASLTGFNDVSHLRGIGVE